MEQYRLLNLVPTEEKHQLLREILFGTQQKGKDREMEWNKAFCQAVHTFDTSSRP
jgi:hypothetical protein